MGITYGTSTHFEAAAEAMFEEDFGGRMAEGLRVAHTLSASRASFFTDCAVSSSSESG